MVKFQVFPGVSLDIFLGEGLLKALDARFQFHEAALTIFSRRHGGSQPFKVFPNEKQLENVLLRNLDDESPPLRKNFNKPFLFKAIDRLADRRPTDSKRLSDFNLFDLFPRIHLSI